MNNITTSKPGPKRGLYGRKAFARYFCNREYQGKCGFSRSFAEVRSFANPPEPRVMRLSGSFVSPWGNP
jgi:hypothetical protein